MQASLVPAVAQLCKKFVEGYSKKCGKATLADSCRDTNFT